MVYRLHLYTLYIFALCCIQKILSFSGEQSYLFCLPMCYYLADVIYDASACLNYMHEPIEKAIFGGQPEFTCWKLTIKRLDQSAKFCYWFFTGKWWLGDLKKLIFIEQISERPNLKYDFVLREKFSKASTLFCWTFRICVCDLFTPAYLL